MTDTRDERGTVKREGSADDRRPASWRVWLLGMFTCMAIMVGVTTYLLVKTQRSQSRVIAAQLKTQRSQTQVIAAQRLALKRQDSALLGSCRRLQVERDRVNVNDAAVYLTLSNAQTNPTNPPEIRTRYQRLAEAASWSPPADCREAIDDPDHYLPPPPIPYHCLIPTGFAVSVVRAKILNDVRTRRGRPASPLPRPADVKPGCPESLPSGLPGG